MIHPHSASTFAQITHRGVDFISNTLPTEIGVCYTPFPITSIRPETSAFPGDKIPRCSSCSAFFNKFNTIEPTRLFQFKCSLCGRITQTSIQIDPNGAECRNEVYEAVLHKNYIKRPVFIPTDYFIISISLLKTNPRIIDAIFESYSSCYHPKQVGVAFVHGGISVIKFRGQCSIQTFPDCAPIARNSQLFAAAPYFRDFMAKNQKEILNLKYIENFDAPRNMIDFGISISTLYGSSLKLLLDENDFHSVARLNSLKYEALKMCQFRSQASVMVFTDNEIKYRNPLIDLPSYTGGFFRLQKVTSNINFKSNRPSNLSNSSANLSTFPPRSLSHHLSSNDLTSDQANNKGLTILRNTAPPTSFSHFSSSPIPNVNNTNPLKIEKSNTISSSSSEDDDDEEDYSEEYTNNEDDDDDSNLTPQINSKTQSDRFIQNQNCDDLGEILSLFKPSLYHDTFIFVRPPNFNDVLDYSSHGFLKTNTGVTVSKIQAGDAFYFTMDASKFHSPYIQFAVFYTTEINERRFRVVTLPLMLLPVVNIDIIRNYAIAMVAHRILIEDAESARQFLKSLKKKFANFDDKLYEKADILINSFSNSSQINFATFVNCIEIRNNQRRILLPSIASLFSNNNNNSQESVDINIL